jgi:hypothetical protein
MNKSIGAAPVRQGGRDARRIDVFRRMNRAWWAEWVRYASQLRGGVK